MRIVNPVTGESYFSKRRRRFTTDRAPHELTFSCYRGYPFLGRDRVREWFVGTLERTRHSWPVDLWAWVIMPEHVHLLVAPRERGVAIGHFQGQIKEQVARTAINWMEDNSPEWIPHISIKEGKRTRRRFWQPGGGYDRNVDDVATALQMIEYIHLNPVRRGLVTRAIDWEWSSARWYAGSAPVRLKMDRTIPSIHLPGGET